ncbi:MAG: hypothetical protein RBU30_01115 [Polyangia bacterium]|jgi:hypothetical protein|nr:hypothetical protein [Polyangia bacterium]
MTSTKELCAVSCLAITMFIPTWLGSAQVARAAGVPPGPRQAPSGTTQASSQARAAPATPQRPEEPPDARLENRIKELEAKLKKLEQGLEDTEVKQIVTDGQVEAITPKKKGFETKSFEGHSRSLQGLNPEISITGDLAGYFTWSDGKEYSASERTGFLFRGLGFHFQSNLDPFSLMKAAVSVSPSGVVFGEAYMVWTNVGGVMNITAGKFHQQLGVVNRWHKHGLDQWDFPLMLSEPFGGALNQIGLSFDFQLGKLHKAVSELTIQITNGMNGKAFSGELFSLPTSLVHFKSYWDLTRNTYLELGLTGIVGFNHYRGMPTKAELYTDAGQTNLFSLYDAQGNPVQLPFAPAGEVVNQDIRLTAFGGANLTIFWEPVNKAKYVNFLWRTEFLYGYKQLPDDALGGRHDIQWMGGYSYVNAKLNQRLEVGLRGDLVQRFVEDNSKLLVFQVVPYLTIWQSPWVKIRLEYNYQDGKSIKGTHRAIAQVVFAAGPHKHDRY